MNAPEPKTTFASNVCGSEPGVVEASTVDGAVVATGTSDEGADVAGTSDWRVDEAGLLDGDELHANETDNGRTRRERITHRRRDELRMPYSFSGMTTITALPRKSGRPEPCGFLMTPPLP